MAQNTPSLDASVDDAPPTFDAIPLSHEVRKAVDALGYTHPTPVQRAVFESVASGRDVVVQARTGTGKTAAFGLPVVDRIVDPSLDKAQVLVLSPTRELALQINRELDMLSKYNGVSVTAVYGGAAMQPQVDAISKGTQVIAGTPGRVLDHLERGTLKTKNIVALVLDESDEMLSMGFLPQITKIMEHLPKKHQTLLFSATLPPDVKRIADSRLTDPEFITLSGDHVGALSIEHYIYRSAGRKADELIQIIDIENPESAIVFCNTRDQTKKLATALQKKGFAADWLNADLAQNDREKVMAATREGKLRFLVCTDVAARGIDISHLTHVINADFPESTENYVHRTGRTGRAGKTGTAISLIAPQDVGNLYMLRLTYKIFPVERDLPRAGELQTRKEADLVDFLYRAFSEQPLSEADLRLARRVMTSDAPEIVVAGLLRDHLGGHPKAAETAAEVRREALPPAVESSTEPAPAKKRKKDKEKKKKDKSEKKAAPESNSSSHKSADTSEEKQTRKPTSKDVESKAAPRKAEQSSESRQRPTAQDSQTSKATKPSHKQPADELEVVSAADLLSDEDKALLRGDFVPPHPKSDRSPRDKTPPQTSNGSASPTSPSKSASSSTPTPKESTAEPKRPASARIFVDVGEADKVSEEDFLDTLADNEFSLADVLEIQVKAAHTFISVPAALLDDALDCLDGEDVGGLVVRAEEARPPKKRNFKSPRGRSSRR